KKRGARAGYVYLHSAVDGYSRLAYTEALDDEKADTAVRFMHRARAFFAAHGIDHIHRIVTDNGSCYRAHDFAKVLRGARHQRIRPYTPRHNGKVERYQRILAEEFLYARVWTSELQRSQALQIWNIHYNYHRPHTAAGNRPPASRLHTGVTNVMASYIYSAPASTSPTPTPRPHGSAATTGRHWPTRSRTAIKPKSTASSHRCLSPSSANTRWTPWPTAKRSTPCRPA